MNAIIIHGMPSEQEYRDALHSPAQQHWLPWLKGNLEAQGISTAVPDMPVPYVPRYDAWKAALEQCELTTETILVGHSCGAGFLVRWLSEADTKVGRVVLVAPWIDPDCEERDLVEDFFDFTLDKHLVQKTGGITLFVSNDDEPAILKSAEKMIIEIPGITVHRFEDRGHFTAEDGVTALPELLEVVL